MGSWNQTCMLSNMAIMSGEDVAGIFLVRHNQEDVHDHCYANCFYSPIPFILYGKYNDYGAMEDFTGAHQNVIVDFFKRNTIAMEQGDNKYHDIAVVPDELDLEKIFEADHEGRLFIPHDYKDAKRAVDHVQIKRSLLDKIVSEVHIEDYHGEFGHVHIGFDYLLQGVDEAVELLRNRLEEGLDLWSRRTGPKARGERTPDDYSLVSRTAITDSYNARNLLSQPPAFRFLGERGTYKEAADDFLFYFNETPDLDTARELFIERLKFMWLQTYMGQGRYTWQVPSGAGSQTNERSAYKLMADFMNSEIARQVKQDEEWNGEWGDSFAEEDSESDVVFG